MTPSPDSSSAHVRRNREIWDEWSERYAAAGRRAWGADAVTWGVWQIPESDLHILPEVTSLNVLEFGCGTGYFSAWLARRGGRVVGLDNSFRQLETARALQREFRLQFPLIQADAELPPFPDG